MDLKKDEEIPIFAVVGKVNMGKTSVLSTLLEQDDNEILRVSRIPGETTKNHTYGLNIGGKNVLQFIDTPGFSRPIDAMREIQKFHSGEGIPNRSAIRHFMTHFKTLGEFEDEIELLSPLLDGAGILYIVDTSRDLRDTYVAEMEILRWTGCQRLAVINRQQDGEEGEWRNTLGSYFNLVRTFNAHHAQYRERLSLLKSLLEIDEQHSECISDVIHQIQNEWSGRREEAAEYVLEFIQEALMHEETEEVTLRDAQNEVRKEDKIEQLKYQYFSAIKKLQNQCFTKLLEVYRHHYIESSSDLSIFEGVDIEARETWSKWGLNRRQMALAGGITGAATGGALDLGTAGATHGFGALLGGLFGATASYFKGGSLPNLSISWDHITGASKERSKERRKLTVGVPDWENFPWVLLDAIIFQYHRILERSHGRRDKQKIESQNDQSHLVTNLAREDRHVLTKWFNSCKKKKPDYAIEPEVLEIIEKMMMCEGEGKTGHVPDQARNFRKANSPGRGSDA